MPGISIHVVDVSRGLPALGLHVEVRALDGDVARAVGEGVIGTNGTFAHPMNDGTGVTRGIHEALLHAGDYFRASGQVTDQPAFQEVVVLRFTVLDPADHYHLPVKITPWGLSVWRGA
jgi:5-hydroxyisourate hydrolase